MRKQKGIALIFLVLIIILVIAVLVFVFKNNIEDSHPNRKESNAEYTKMMKNYMEEKYSTSFEVVNTIFPKGGFNTGMLQNVVTLKDSDGVCCDVTAQLNSPYDFYDDYIDSRTAALIQNELNYNIFKTGKGRISVTVKDRKGQKVDASASNILSLTFVGAIYHSPTNEDIQELYDIYQKIQNMGYRNIYFIIGFVNNSSDFDLAVKDYKVYGKSNWSDYNGNFYAYLTVKYAGLSFEDFESCITKP